MTTEDWPYVVERPRLWWERVYFAAYDAQRIAAIEVRDPNGRDGEWHAVVTLPHEIEEYDGYGVPVFEGDVERQEWERQHARR